MADEGKHAEHGTDELAGEYPMRRSFPEAPQTFPDTKEGST